MRNYEKDLELVYRGCDKDCMNCELGKQSQCARNEAYERLLKTIEVLRQYVDFTIDVTIDYNSGVPELFGVITLKVLHDENEVEVYDEEEILLLQEII